MQQIQIKGGRRIYGDVITYGAKNAFLPLLASTLTSSDQIEISNIPLINDAMDKITVLRTLGSTIDFISDRTLSIKSSDAYNDISHLSPNIRTVPLLMGIMLARYGKFKISQPKGDAINIGVRKLNFHIDALEKMGAKIWEEDGFICGEAKQLNGIEYTFPFPSVGAVQNILNAAVVAKGITILRNCSTEPEIAFLCDSLCKMGAKIHGIGTSHLVIIGNDGLLSTGKKVNISVITDRLQAITYLLLPMICGGKITVRGNNLLPMFGEVINAMINLGGRFYADLDKVICEHDGRHICENLNIVTEEFPGFSTDAHPLIVPSMCLSTKQGSLEETIYDGRFVYVDELKKMGANINVYQNKISVGKIDRFTASGNLIAKDIRGGCSILLAALNAEGTSILSGLNHIHRGYDSSFFKYLKESGIELEDIN